MSKKSAHESIKVEKGETNIPVRVPGQRRLAISRFRVPNLDGCVIAAAGNLLSIGTPHHRVDTVFVRSHYINQQKQRKNCLKTSKALFKNLQVRVPGHRALELVSFFQVFGLFVLIDSYADFSQLQCDISGMESGWQAG